MSERDLDDLLLLLRETANPADEVAASEGRVLDRLDRTLASRPRALRAAFRSARRMMLALVALGGVATGAAATAAISLAVPSPERPAIEITADPANPSRISITAVERSTEKPDARRQIIFRGLRRDAPDVRPEDARAIRTADGTRAWVIPGSSRTCFGTDNGGGTGYACTSNASALRGGLATALIDGDDTVHAIYLVADEVTAARVNGRTVRPHNNTISLTYPSGSPVTFITKSGDVAVQAD